MKKYQRILLVLAVIGLTLGLTGLSARAEDQTSSSTSQQQTSETDKQAAEKAAEAQKQATEQVNERAKQLLEKAKEDTKNKQERSDEDKKKSCEGVKEGLKQKLENLDTNSQKVYEKIDSVLQKALEYQKESGVKPTNFDQLVATAQSANVKAKASVEALKGLSVEIDCDKPGTVAQNVASFKAAAEQARNDLKVFRSAVKAVLAVLETSKQGEQ